MSVMDQYLAKIANKFPDKERVWSTYKCIRTTNADRKVQLIIPIDPLLYKVETKFGEVAAYYFRGDRIEYVPNDPKAKSKRLKSMRALFTNVDWGIEKMTSYIPKTDTISTRGFNRFMDDFMRCASKDYNVDVVDINIRLLGYYADEPDSIKSICRELEQFRDMAIATHVYNCKCAVFDVSCIELMARHAIYSSLCDKINEAVSETNDALSSIKEINKP